MSSFLMVLGFIVAVSASFFFILWKNECRKNERVEHEMQSVVATNHVLMEQVEGLQKEIQILSRNRSKADEKVNALHSGDAVGNAVSGLSKH